VEISQLDPQPRGYAYERFLKDLFDAYGLVGRASFRLVGEQIDGSFDLLGDTYLLEAKWKGLVTGASDLRAFNAKLEDKSAWTRGLFVSESGFSQDGLIAFGRGKRVVCMDGLDLHDMLDECLSLIEVLSKKSRHLAETGEAFVRVRDLR
jgi:restriction endonuclease Mrr